MSGMPRFSIFFASLLNAVCVFYAFDAIRAYPDHHPFGVIVSISCFLISLALCYTDLSSEQGKNSDESKDSEDTKDTSGEEDKDE